jgi:DNA primase
MGTAITEKQFNILRKLTKNIVFSLDADVAGEEATRRGIEITIETSEKRVPMMTPVKKWSGKGKTIKVGYLKTPDLNVKVVRLPSGKDPDEIIKEDVAQWQSLIEKAVPVFDFIIENVISQLDLKEARGKSLAVDRLLPIISKIEDPIRQAHYLRVLVRKLDVNEESLQKALREYEIEEHRKLQQETERQFSSAPFISQFSPSEKFRPVEEYCLALLLQYPELRTEIEELRPEYFQYTENRELFHQWQQSPELASLKSNLDPVLNEYVDHLLEKFSKSFPTSILQSEKEQRHALNDCILRLQERWLKSLETERGELLSLAAEKNGVMGQLSALEEQGLEVNIRLKRIYNKQKGKGI